MHSQRLESEILGLTARREQLRQAAALPGAQLQQTLEAAFAELDGAIDMLTSLRGQPAGQPAGPPPGDQSADGPQPDRQAQHAVFQQAPVPLFLLERDGTVQEANRSAGYLLGFPPGYATGKTFTAFVDLPARAAVSSQIAAARRTGEARQVNCGLLGAAGPVRNVLDISRVRLAGQSAQLIVAATRPGPASAPPHQERAADQDAGTGPGQGTVATARTSAGRLDVLSAATRLVLESATVSESAMLQRCARLLAGELAAWVIVDAERQRRLRRQFVIGPQDDRSVRLARSLADLDPQPESAPSQVHQSGSSLLIAHAEDPGLLGTGPDGVPILARLGATSVLSVPLSDGERCYGTLTLAHEAGYGYFGMADVGLVEEIGEYLALAIRVDRKFRRSADIAAALRADLHTPRLPVIPGIEIAAAHQDATLGPAAGGDFCSVYRTASGWGIAIGDVCGNGRGMTAVNATARHAIRAAAHRCPDPAEVLRMVNEILLAEEFGGRFVTAAAAHLQWRDDVLRVTLGSAGHPLPVLVRPDGRVQTMDGGGLPLGIFADSGPQARELSLSRGDVLFFFTDGLTDARSPQLTHFEDHLTEELAALAGRPPAEVAAGMRQAVLKFCGSELRDDVTMFVLRAGEPPAAGR